MKRALIIVALAALAGAGTKKDVALEKLPDMSAVRANLAFTCAHEADHLPPLDADANQVFLYGRYLQKKDGPKDFNEVARYYRIAAAHGHYKANQNLQRLVSEGLVTSPNAPKEVVDLAAHLIEQGVPGGYYDIGHYLEVGYGLKQDSEMSLRYFRKAADLGSPEAQTYVAELLAPLEKAPDVAREMRQCAMGQGYGDAAYKLGIHFLNQKQYTEAVNAFQEGARAGHTGSASFLEDGFKGPPASDRLNYMSLPNDPERSRRYNLIRDFIDRNESRNPKVPDIDKIVPLPPAHLPRWDGTFQWEKEQAAAVPPQKPSDELIKRLSEEAHLDPATGLPLAQPDHVSQSESTPPVESRSPVGTLAQTGQPCPESGVWRASLPKGMIADVERRFLKGTELPTLTAYQPRAFNWLDERFGVRKQTMQVTWTLIDYIAEA